MKPVVTVMPRKKTASPSLRPPSPRTNNVLLVKTSPSVGVAANANQLRNSIGGSISASKRHGSHDQWQPLNTAIKAKAVNSHKKNTSPQLDDQFLLNQSADFDAASFCLETTLNHYKNSTNKMAVALVGEELEWCGSQAYLFMAKSFLGTFTCYLLTYVLTYSFKFI